MSGVVAKDCSFSGSFVFWKEGGRKNGFGFVLVLCLCLGECCLSFEEEQQF